MQTIFAPRSRSSFASLRRINNIEQNLPDTGARSKRYPLVSTERDGEIRSQWDRHKGSGTRRGAYEIELDPRHSIESERNDLTSQLPGDGHRH